MGVGIIKIMSVKNIEGIYSDNIFDVTEFIKALIQLLISNRILKCINW